MPGREPNPFPGAPAYFMRVLDQRGMPFEERGATSNMVILNPLAGMVVTIFGVGVRSDYPEDEPTEKEAFERGYFFAWCYSELEPEGEYGSQPLSEVQEISKEAFEEARAKGWKTAAGSYLLRLHGGETHVFQGTWPLPDRLLVRRDAHGVAIRTLTEGDRNTINWPQDSRMYLKVGESQLGAEADDHPGVMRGAEYAPASEIEFWQWRFPDFKWAEPIKVETVGHEGYYCRCCIARNGLKAAEIENLAMPYKEAQAHIEKHKEVPA